jgi:hypothetical protein|uniref:thiol oxidase n=1 Tax=viral metagenome TaxID=1070528 RepID=A0A6C0BHL8_9ZZZZ
MQPSVWGPCLWRSIHVIALGYPYSPTDEDKKNYKEFYENFWKVIPCQKCSVNYKRHLEELEHIDGFLSSPDDLFSWTVALHNIVNNELGKRLYTVEEAKQIHSQMPLCEVKKDVNTSTNINNIIYVIIAVVVILIASVLIIQRFNKR